MAQQKLEVLRLTILVETDQSNMFLTMKHTKRMAKEIGSKVNNATVAVIILDENDKFLGIDVDGDPSETMQERIRIESGPLSEDEVVSA